jgi:putative peptidoglycan lipid II flippase
MIVFQVIPLLIGNFYTGILQSHNLFFIPAIAPVVYNVGIIIGIVFLTATYGLWAPVIGVGIGACFFMFIQIPPLIKLGYRQKFTIHIHDEGVKEVGKLMLPRTLGLAVTQVDTTVDLILSTLLGARMVTVFNFAQQLQQLPIGLFGATVAQAALPILSQSTASGDKDQFKKTLESAINQIMFFVMPISALFIVLRIPIVRVVFGASRYDWQATVMTGMTLSAFSVSLFAQAISQLLTRAFYAHYDTFTPVVIGVGTILLNTALSIVFLQVYHLPVWGLGLSTSLASFANIVLLFIFLKKKLPWLGLGGLVKTPLKIIFASVVTGVALYVPLKLFDQLIFDTTRTSGLLLLTGVSGIIGLIVYLSIVWLLGVGEARSFLAILGKVRHLKTIVMEPASEVIDNGGQNTPIS